MSQSTYDDFQDWLSTVEEWVHAFTDCAPEQLAPHAIRAVVRMATNPALFRELERRDALELDSVTWAGLTLMAKEVLRIAPHNLRIALRE